MNLYLIRVREKRIRTGTGTMSTYETSPYFKHYIIIIHVHKLNETLKLSKFK